MKQVLVRKGLIFTAEVPAPLVEPGAVLVSVRASCISPATESAGITASGKSLLQRVLEQPDKAAKAVGEMRRDGVLSVLERARNKFNAEKVTGYSAAGVVMAVGAKVKDLCVGDRVAAAGAGYAVHAAEIVVPVNLTAKIPNEVSFEHASTVALGAIAMHGVRRAQTGLSESVVVIGCGALGLLTVQLLKVAGCRVIATDLNPARVDLAKRLGAEVAIGVEESATQVRHFTNGYGADAVIVTAATASSEPLRLAFQMCRAKGRTVLVGAVGPEFDREGMYTKELDLVMSTSYGPGRYDDLYERSGVDYPYGYVRWTERRNMEAYMRLLACKAIRLEEMMGETFSVDRVEEAYASVSTQSEVLAVISYPECRTDYVNGSAGRDVPLTRCATLPIHARKMKMAVVGAGEFVRAVHAPNLRRMADRYEVKAVVCRSGVSARTAAVGFEGCTPYTDLERALSAGEVDAVLIGTRHDQHARQALGAMRAGKAVFLEKPMCLTQEECTELGVVLSKTNGLFMVGYNRRFSPFVQEIRAKAKDRINPLMIHYTMNAGYQPYDHWTQTAEGGGRIIGEACHVIDLLRFIIGFPVKTISSATINPNTGSVRCSDNCALTLTYEDGSVASVLYTAIGSREYQKERMEVFFDERAMIMDDYRTLREFGDSRREVTLRRQDKGHAAELEAFHRAWREGIRFPIPWDELKETWEVTWRLSHAIRGPDTSEDVSLYPCQDR